METNELGNPGPGVSHWLKFVGGAAGGSVLFVDAHCGIPGNIPNFSAVDFSTVVFLTGCLKVCGCGAKFELSSTPMSVLPPLSVAVISAELWTLRINFPSAP